MFLKSYTRFLDAELIENLNSNIHYQLFCGARINPLKPLTNFKLVSAIRCELASLFPIDELQEVLSAYWKPYMANLQVHMTDTVLKSTPPPQLCLSCRFHKHYSIIRKVHCQQQLRSLAPMCG